MDDVLAVMDAAGSESAAICGTLEGGPMAALFAATFPERTDALVLYATFARATWAPGYEFAWPAEMRDQHMDGGHQAVGPGLGGGRRGSEQGAGPGLHGVGRAAGAAGREPRDDPPHLRPDRGVRRARRAAVDPRADARDAPQGRQLHQGRPLALHRLEDPRARATWSSRARTTCSRSATRRRSSARSRSSSPARATSTSPTGCSPPCCSRTSATPPRRAAEMGDRGWRFLLERHDALFRQALEPPPRPRGEAHGRRLPGDLRRARARDPLRRVGRRGDGLARARRSAPASTRASSR